MTCTLKCVILLFRAYMLIYLRIFNFMSLLLIVSGMFKQFSYTKTGLYRVDSRFIVSIFCCCERLWFCNNLIKRNWNHICL